jgi:hypothetical protein
LSTLTKILIVLITISTILLCGFVISYVTSSVNYKERYESQTREKNAAVSKAEDMTDQLNKMTEETDRLSKKLNASIQSLNSELNSVKTELGNAKRENSAMLAKVESFAAITKDFNKTNSDQYDLLQKTLDELDAIQASLIKREKEVDDLTTALDEKMAIVDTLEADKRRLLEQKTELQARLDEQLMPTGKRIAVSQPVTKDTSTIKIAPSTKASIDLKGLVTEVDLQNSATGISIGKVDGVKIGMIFHVIRGDQFIRDILIIDVEDTQAVGVFQLGEGIPKNGDTVATNF